MSAGSIDLTENARIYSESLLTENRKDALGRASNDRDERPGYWTGTPCGATLASGSGAGSMRRGIIREPCSAPLSSSRYCASELTRQRS
jgi:hypothetical protein